MKWTFTQIWDGLPPYIFDADVSDNGLIAIEGGFMGVMTPPPGVSENVSLAIANPAQQSVAAYLGVSGSTFKQGTVLQALPTGMSSLEVGQPPSSH